MRAVKVEEAGAGGGVETPAIHRRPLVIRVLSAAVLLAVIIGAVVAGPAPTLLMLAALIMVGTYEFYTITRGMNVPAAPWVLFPLTLLLLFRFQLGALPLVLHLGITLAVAGGLAVFLLARRPIDAMARWAMALAGAFYIGWMLSFYFALYTANNPDPDRIGFAWIVALAGSSILGDTAALVFGTRFGRHRFFPAISPRKSWEGAVAGFVVQAGFFSLFSQLANVPWPHSLVLGALVAIAAQAGDLIESQFKRAAGLKDASALIPGHGGMLDRMDSLILLPGVAYYYMVLVLHANLPR
ncbi:MAG: phosphatidate cytidylyltransferase [Candidatus Dormibacteria bacterium]